MGRGKRIGAILTALFFGAASFLSVSARTLAAEDATAATIRLQKTEGTVTVRDAAGKTQAQTIGMRLFSGSEVATAAGSYAWLNLDDTKALKLDASSDVLVTKNGKNLDVTLNEGKVFFDVSEKLKEDENFHIRTSTMVMGIRGTIGIVERVDSNHAIITILEGQVAVNVKDPVTGAERNGIVRAGETADSRVFTAGGTEDVATITVRRVTQADIDGFALAEIADGNAADTASERFLATGGATVLSRRIYNATASRLDLRGVTAQAAQEQIAGTQGGAVTGFDAAYYAARYPDVVAALGNDPTALLQHYLTFGQYENRVASPAAQAAVEAAQTARLAAWEQFQEELRVAIAEQRAAESEARRQAEDDDEEETSTGPTVVMYAIKPDSTEQYHMTVDPTSAASGSAVTVTVSIENNSLKPGTGGYSIRVYNASDNALVTSETKDRLTNSETISFTMPAADVNIKVEASNGAEPTPAPVPVPSNP